MASPVYINNLTSLTPSNTTIDDVQASCNSHKTCDECLHSSITCHFCEKDFQCHAIPNGCLIGMRTCHHLEDCLRKEPQHVGYGPPPSVVIAVLCLVVTLTCCLCGMSAICSVFLHRRRPKTAFKPTISATTAARAGEDVDQAAVSPTQSDPLLLDEEMLVFEDNVDQQAMERLRNVHVPERTSGFWRRLGWKLLWLGTLIGTTVFALMFYPRMPDYNVCNRQFDYESILHSLVSFSFNIEFQVLMSVINENRFGFQLERGRADIYHNETWVGKWVLNKTWEAKAGAISDVIAPIVLNPGYGESLKLLENFRNNNLVFRINASITGSITWGTHKIYRISSSSVPDIEFLVGAEYDRGLCKCTEYLTPQLTPP